MMNPSDRPKQPFVDSDGRPRIETTLSARGPVAFRAGEAVLDLNAIDGGRDNIDGLVSRLQKQLGYELRIEDEDRAQAGSSGFLRVRFDAVPVEEFIRRVNVELEHSVALVNTVFTIGSVTADPMRFGAALTADPMRFGSAYGDPMRFGNSSTARPSSTPTSPADSPRVARGAGRATIAILDTGVEIVGLPEPSDVDFVGFGGGIRDSPDLNTDDFLDIAAGHSTFIRTIIQRAVPDADVTCEGVIHNDGDGSEADIANALKRVFDVVADTQHLIVNLSFSGYYDNDEEPPMIAFWIREMVACGAVVVAAAGNDGACRKKYPAAMPEVLSVGALGSCGPASFSNHGNWVDVSAPGEDLVSEFFDNFDGAFEPIIPGSVPDIDDFSGWAMWSGTSFATPAVVGALAELVELHDCTAKQAVDTLINTPGLFRIPDYGVVVNRVF